MKTNDILRNYPERARKTAIYKEAGTGSLLAVIYPGVGVSCEALELLEKLSLDHSSPTLREDVKKEAGDVLWMIAMLSIELKFDFVDTVTAKEKASEWVSNTASLARAMERCEKVASLVTKYMRDSDTKKRREQIIEAVKHLMPTIHSILGTYNITLEEAAAYNIIKLSDRKDRGVLEGSGDDR